jgi:hypothetical protein
MSYVPVASGTSRSTDRTTSITISGTDNGSLDLRRAHEPEHVHVGEELGVFPLCAHEPLEDVEVRNGLVIDRCENECIRKRSQRIAAFW